MTPEALTALKSSIAKWERNAKAKTPDEYLIGGDNCPLCAIFTRSITASLACPGCPVSEHTGRGQCRSTPYYDTERASYAWRLAPNDEARRDKAHAAARDEVAFLKSLLPEGETP